jgi:AraC family transcriptional regulator, arabinose operon regulatory protein
MVIDWEKTTLRISLTGRSAWPRGQWAEWRASIPDHDLWFAVRGTGRMIGQGNTTIPLAAGTCLWLTPGHTYVGTHEPDDPLVNYFVHFVLVDRAGRIRPYHKPRPPEVLEAGDGVIVGAIMRRIVELIPFYTPETADRFVPEHIDIAHGLMRGLLMDLDHASQTKSSSAVSGTRRHHHEVIMRAIAQAQDRSLTPCTVGTLADSAGYSPEHFSRIFRTVVGQPPEEFLIRLRIEHAKQMLVNSPMSISEIANVLGYRQASFFSVQFRQWTGKSPSEYRETKT